VSKNMPVLKILVIQPDCRDYRIPLFERLSDDFIITLLHFGKKKFINGDSVSELELNIKKITSFKYIENLREECNKFDCIITVFDPHWVNCFTLPFLTKKPVIFWGHGVGRSKFVSQLRKIVGKRAQSLITYDEEGKQSLIDIGLIPQKIFVAPNTIHVSNSQNFSHEEKDSILYVGRLQKRKELDVLIKSFAQIYHQLPENTGLKILGDGDQVLSDLKRLTQHLEISNKIEFVKGTTDDEELAQHFKQAYCYASPGPVGLGVLHSFAYGIPVITFEDRDHGPEVSNLKNNENALLVDGNNRDFGESLVKLINTGAFKKLGDNAYQHYSNSRTIEQMVLGFREAIEYSLRE
jgi:glycosyltransferase involved in cell wall biosynthesis